MRSPTSPTSADASPWPSSRSSTTSPPRPSAATSTTSPDAGSSRASTAVTNCLHTASTLSSQNRAEVQLVGGRVRGITQAAVGSATVDALRDMRVDVAFLGANGFTLDHGFSTPDPAEGAVKRAMVGCARRVVVLADSSKFGSEYLVSFAAVTDVDVLITDRGLAPSARQSLIEQGIEVVLA